MTWGPILRNLHRAFQRNLNTSYWLSGLNLWVEHFAYWHEVKRRAANIRDIRNRKAWRASPGMTNAFGLSNQQAYTNALASQQAANYASQLQDLVHRQANSMNGGGTHLTINPNYNGSRASFSYFRRSWHDPRAC